MSKIITISREFMSGGADIGHAVAERLGIPCYDKTILDKTAEELHFDKSLVKRYDEKTNGIWKNFSGFQYGYRWYAADPSMTTPVNETIANAQFDAIRKFADEGPCVIIGRCADYVLRERDDVLNVFIRCRMSKRIMRAKKLYNIDGEEAKKLIKKTDKIRANYYEAHTDRPWGSSGSFDIVLDTGRLGIDPAIDLILMTSEYLDKNERKAFE